MGVDGCSSFVGGSLGGDGVVVSSSFERDMGADGTLKSLLMCTGSNHGIGSRISIGPGVMVEGGVMVRETVSPGVTGGVGYCETGLDDDLHTVMSVGISLEVTVSGVIELTGDSGSAIMSVGVSVDMTGGEVMQLGDDSLGDVRSATVSVGITVDTDMLSLMGSSTSMLRPVRSRGRGLSRLHCANVTL